MTQHNDTLVEEILFHYRRFVRADSRTTTHIGLNEQEATRAINNLIEAERLRARAASLEPIKEWLNNYDSTKTIASLKMLVFDEEYKLLAELSKLEGKK